MFVAIDSREGTLFEFRTRCGFPEVDSVGGSSIKILECVLDPVVVVVVGAAVCLGEFNACVCKIGASSRHGPDEFINATAVCQLHRFGEFLLDVGVRVANGGIELLKPGGVRG